MLAELVLATAKTSIRVGEEGDTIRSELSKRIDALEQSIPKVIDAAVTTIHERMDKHEQTTIRTLRKAGIEWVEDVTIIPGSKGDVDG